MARSDISAQLFPHREHRENICFTFSRKVGTSDYTYYLPPEKIAFYPLSRRDDSKLLVYKEGEISHTVFSDIPEHLPEDAFLFFNDTKVIPARLHFQKQSGAIIEIFLLSPIEPSPLMAVAMSAREKSTWQCTIGNLKKWPAGVSLSTPVAGTVLVAELRDRRAGTVEFSWDSDHSFAEIVHAAGETPLPPYIKRKADEADTARYQTIYSHYDGAVAAPTAGLHFTEEVFRRLSGRNIGRDFLTLHVSAGTFQPIKAENADEHVMHEEQVIVTRANVENLLVPGRFIIPVGTTSMRTLESLYWYGVKLLKDPLSKFIIGQRDPYTISHPPSTMDALGAVGEHMKTHGLREIVGETSIFIHPGYSFKVCNGLITNFHQPASTLILLVAAFIGEDWRIVYDEALKNNYRFLSYGDSSLLLPG
ncbi:MAG: S-adenosylmethionine:tRNA ribosyltransferase-isomerase [Bacteroidota bacterium]|nr:S-adenosylmethionine:tRNA ribosyltransferase-isomerase [Bacteroidota bacterium]